MLCGAFITNSAGCTKHKIQPPYIVQRLAPTFRRGAKGGMANSTNSSRGQRSPDGGTTIGVGRSALGAFPDALKALARLLARQAAADAAISAALEIGATSRAIEGQPPEIHSAVADAIRRVLVPHQRGSSVPLEAGFWLITGASA